MADEITTCKVTDKLTIGGNNRLTILAGPCVIETEDICRRIADFLSETCRKLDIQLIFKASFDKANRTSFSSFRGPGLEKGLDVLEKIKKEFSLPILTDIHEPRQAAPVAEVADILQIPAFLARQTDLLVAAGQTGRAVNVKKGQFLAPADMQSVIEKIQSTDNYNITLTERGTTFGYHNLVVDMRSLVIMRQLGIPVIFDCTHAVQRPGGQGKCSGGDREFVAPLARAATATGIDGLFMEVHPQPDKALSDGANSLPFEEVTPILKTVKAIHEINR
ncbi:MAG: 3-deoxy-8-phosphooctulonate synthase [Verrucomicrobiota bacterium]